MKALFALALICLSVSSFELVDTISEEEFSALYEVISEEPEVSEFARGDWEVVGIPGTIHVPKKGPATDRYKHVKDVTVALKKGMKSFKAAVALVKWALNHKTGTALTAAAHGPECHKKWVCSYAYVSKAGWGHTVWCSKRDKFGHHTRMYDYKQGAFFTGGYMV